MSSEKQPAKKNAWRRVLAAGIVLCAGLGLSAYLWTATGREPLIDPNIASMLQTHTCRQCGADFQLSVREATAMRRTRGDLYCTRCGAAGVVLQADPSETPEAPRPPAEKGDSSQEKTGSDTPRKPQVAPMSRVPRR